MAREELAEGRREAKHRGHATEACFVRYAAGHRDPTTHLGNGEIRIGRGRTRFRNAHGPFDAERDRFEVAYSVARRVIPESGERNGKIADTGSRSHGTTLGESSEACDRR